MLRTKILRWFRDNYVSEQDISHYYDVAPRIVEAIKNTDKADILFNKIYLYVIIPCIKDIQNHEYSAAYNRYKKTILAFENKYLKNELNSTKSL